MEAQMVTELSLCPLSHHVSPVPTLAVISENPLALFPQRRDGKKKKKFLGRVCKGLQPLSCAAWGPPSVLMVLGIITWSHLVPPKHGIKTNNYLVMGNAHLLWRVFHLLCTLPLRSTLECLHVRGYLHFFLALNHLVDKSLSLQRL